MLELTPMRPAFLICFLILAGMLLGEATPPAASTPTAVCTSGVGPGIPPPANVPSGLPGFHAAWYGQSGYPILCPGERATATVAYYNSGSFGWVRGRMGEMAFLGTSDPVPGHDQPSQLGGDGQLGSPATGWPRYNRVAVRLESTLGRVFQLLRGRKLTRSGVATPPGGRRRVRHVSLRVMRPS